MRLILSLTIILEKQSFQSINQITCNSATGLDENHMRWDFEALSLFNRHLVSIRGVYFKIHSFKFHDTSSKNIRCMKLTYLLSKSSSNIFNAFLLIVNLTTDPLVRSVLFYFIIRVIYTINALFKFHDMHQLYILLNVHLLLF